MAGALAAGRPAVVLGEAGIGKTAVLDTAAGRHAGPVYRGGGLHSLSWLAYLPLSRAVRTELHGEPDGVADEITARIGPGLLVLDDLQWADPQTLAALGPMAEHVAVLAAVRSGDDGEPSAMAAARAVGAAVVPVGPLPERALEGLVATWAPGSPVDQRRLAVAGAGGNPLLAQELLRTGAAGAGLRDALVARLRGVSAGARATVALLSLLGRPVSSAVAGDASDELEAAGLVTVRGGRVALRHALHGEAALAQLDGDARQLLHRRAARLVSDPGEAARHHAAGGEREHAAARAREAAERATSAGDRARHLTLAAECSDGDGASTPGLFVAAAGAALDAGDAEAALRLLAGAGADLDSTLGAAAALAEVRARARLGDAAGARTRAEQALALHPAPAVAAALLSELGALLAWPLWRPAEAMSRAAAACEGARAAGAGAADVRRARVALATARLAGAQPDWRAEAEAAGGEAAATVLACGTVLSGAGAGDPSGAGAGGAAGAVLSLHLGGDCQASADALGAFATAPAQAGRDVVTAHLAVALADAGRTGDALAVVGDAQTARPTPVGEALLWWAQAEAEWQAARPKRARAAARSCAEASPAGFPAADLAAVVDAWSALELGEQPAGDTPAAPWPALDAVPLELRAVAALAAGDASGAESCFAAAAARWRPVHRRGELRCRWGAAEAALRAGQADRARLWLEDLERDAAELGQRPMVARARAGLRRLGVRRPPARGAGRAGLTGREVDVLGLVGDGLTTGEIAARLGVARSTVDTQVESAVRKLGARTRVRAAALLRERTRA